jgi:DNA replication licensing factor MCM2
MEAAKAAGLASTDEEGGDTTGLGVGEQLEEAGFKPIDQVLLRKYILHAREKVRPSLAEIDAEKIPKLYAELRREAEVSSGVPIAVRHIESMLRMAEAVARMRLADYVSVRTWRCCLGCWPVPPRRTRPLTTTASSAYHAVQDSDLNTAIRTQLHSFISAQKLGAQRALRMQFQRYLNVDRKFDTLLLMKVRELAKEYTVRARVEAGLARPGGVLAAVEDATADVRVKVSDLLERARRLGVTDISDFLKSKELAAAGFAYDAESNAIVRHMGEAL